MRKRNRHKRRDNTSVKRVESFHENMERSENTHTPKKYGYKFVELAQPVASMLLSGLVKVIKFKGKDSYEDGEIVFVYAKEVTEESTKELWDNDSLYSIFVNAVNMGNIVEEELPVNSFIGYVRIGKRTKNGFYGIRNAEVFDRPTQIRPNDIFSHLRHEVKIKKVSLEERIIKVPLGDEAWALMNQKKDDVYFYWEQSFNNLYSYKYGFGDIKGLYDVLFYNKGQQKRFHQLDRRAVRRVEYISEPDNKPFYALVFNFEKFVIAKKYEEVPFEALKKKHWILDWNCVKFKQGYFVVVPPVDGSVKFKPEAVSSPGVMESFNYLKDYLNDRLQPIHCSVEGMKLTIYDSLRLNEAIERFATVSRQKAIKVPGTSGSVKKAPQQLSFKQALSKAQKMSPEEFKKYKSEFIDFLVTQQSKKYKVIPCVERMAHTTGDTTEYAFMFSIECKSRSILIVHENVNPDRSTLLFIVKRENYDKAIRAIYDFLQSAEINKRSSIRSGDIDRGQVGIERYNSINHDFINSWQRVILNYKRYQ